MRSVRPSRWSSILITLLSWQTGHTQDFSVPTFGGSGEKPQNIYQPPEPVVDESDQEEDPEPTPAFEPESKDDQQPDRNKIARSQGTANLRGEIRLGTINNDEFISYKTLSARLRYSLSSRIDVGLTLSTAFDEQTGLTAVLESEAFGLKRADIQEVIGGLKLVHITGSFAAPTSQVRPYVGLGLGFIDTQEFPADDPEGRDVSKGCLALLLGLEWTLTERIGLNLEMTNVWFKKFGSEGEGDNFVAEFLGIEGVSIPLEISFGFSYGWQI